MSPISLLGRAIQVYADAAALGIQITNNHSLFGGDNLLEEDPIDDLYNQVYILRGYSGEPIAHIPVSRVPVLGRWIQLTGIDGQQVSSLR